MMNPKFQEDYARAVVNGIESYIRKQQAKNRYKNLKKK